MKKGTRLFIGAAGAAVVVVVAGVAYFRTPPVHSVERPEDFLADVRNLRDSGGGSDSADGLVASNLSPTEAPRIQVPSDTFEMGLISHKEPTTKKMMVKNTGGSPLIISDVRTSCGCTHGAFENAETGRGGKPVTTIAPGKEEPLLITVDPFRVPTFHSSKTLTLQTNDPEKVAVNITVNADVIPEFDLPAEHLDFGDVDQGEAAKTSIIIRQTGEDHYDLKAIEAGTRSRGGAMIPGAVKETAEASDPLYTVSMRELPKEQWSNPEYKEWEITAHLSPNVPPGSFTDFVWVDTTAPRYKKLRLSLKANLTSFYEVSPQIVTVRKGVSPGAEGVGEVAITASSPLEISDLNVSGTDLVLRTEPTTDANIAKIEVSVAPSAQPGLKNEIISFDVKVGERTAKHTMRAFISVKGPA